MNDNQSNPAVFTSTKVVLPGVVEPSGLLREDAAHVLSLLAQGKLKPQIAARFPLAQIQAAMEFAESHTAYGKVILLPNK